MSALDGNFDESPDAALELVLLMDHRLLHAFPYARGWSGRKWLFDRGLVSAHEYPSPRAYEHAEAAKEAADAWSRKKGFESLADLIARGGRQ